MTNPIRTYPIFTRLYMPAWTLVTIVFWRWGG